ncbi:MAG: DUF1846 domain-containing protein [Eubacteriales bacterium]|nr:DUF1846 domain-containing protein [Eubacteriales bacterium]
MLKYGFDRDLYLEQQSEYIMERVNAYSKLYLEFGGKLIGDLHAMRCLPGFDANAKIKLLHKLREQVEIIICVYAGDVENNKIRGDYGTSYDREVLRMIDDFRAWDLEVNSVVITRYAGEPAAEQLYNVLKARGLSVYFHSKTKGYPLDVDTIVSPEGYGQNPYIETTKPLVVLTAPGPNSGKLATCLSQLYHDSQHGIKAGYSKFETFPVWNLPLKHPVNVAYECATADLRDVNMIDPFHFEKYGISTVNYNRDVEAFPVLRRILTKILGKDCPFASPTELSVNRVGFCITDNEVVEHAAKQEIIRRYFAAACDYKLGRVNLETMQRCKLLMEELNLRDEDRAVVTRAHEYLAEVKARTDIPPLEFQVVAAMELTNGRLVTGRASEHMTATAACLLNALKALAGLNDELHLLAPSAIDPMYRLKAGVLKQHDKALNSQEVLMALAISAATNPLADLALKQLRKLKASQGHVTAILKQAEKDTYRNLGIDVSCDPIFASENLYYDA